MKKIFILMMILISFCLWSETPILLVEDNEDGTIYIEATFPNGEPATGAKIILKLKSNNSIFWEGTISEDSLETEMPKEPYTVTMDNGSGNIVTQDGPQPDGGFGAKSVNEKTTEQEKQISETNTLNSETAWTPAMTTAAIPPKPPTTWEIVQYITGILQVLILAYIVILIKRNKN